MKGLARAHEPRSSHTVFRAPGAHTRDQRPTQAMIRKLPDQLGGNRNHIEPISLQSCNCRLPIAFMRKQYHLFTILDTGTFDQEADTFL